MAGEFATISKSEIEELVRDEDDIYRSLREELETLAYIPEFYLKDSSDGPSELTVADRMAPAAWNAKRLFELAQDPMCPNADWFRDGLSRWILGRVRFHKTRLQLSQGQTVEPKPGVSWPDFFPGWRPISKRNGEPPFVDLTLESQISALQKELNAINEILALVSQSNAAELHKTYRALLDDLKSLL